MKCGAAEPIQRRGGSPSGRSHALAKQLRILDPAECAADGPGTFSLVRDPDCFHGHLSRAELSISSGLLFDLGRDHSIG